MEELWQDVRYGARTLVKAPEFTVITLLALGLGIGANTAIYSLVNAVLLRPLPFHEPERLVTVWEEASHVGFPRNTPAVANYADWKAQNQVFEDMAAVRWVTFNLTGEGEPEKLEATAVTANLFSLLGVKPAAGRVFLPEEDKPGANRVVLVSHGLWQRRFGGSRDLVGRDIQLDGNKVTVVGIMPSSFQFPDRENELWVPAAFSQRELTNRGSHYLRVFARLKRGVTLKRAQADMETIARRLEKEYPGTNTHVGVLVVPLHEEVVLEVRLALIVLLAAVGFVLLIACANVANLLLTRAAGRQREIAVRTALGATGMRLIRQLLTESLLLAGLGGVLGLIMASGSFSVLAKLIPDNLPGANTLGLDLRVLVFTIILSLLTGVLFGIAPALHFSRLDVNEALKQGGARSGIGGKSRMLRSGLVVAEIAMALVLLIGAGLMIQSFARLRGLEPGFRPENLLTLRLELPRSKYSELPKRSAFYQQVLERVKSLPGVKSAGFTSFLPLTMKGGTNGFTIEGRPAPAYGKYPDANYRVVSPEYLRTLGIPLRQGRHFEERDGPDAPLVVIINEAMASQFFRNEDPLKKRFKLGDYDSDQPWLTIVGIAGDVKQMGLEVPGRAEMYVPYQQSQQVWAMPRDLAIRTAADPMSLAATVRREVWNVDKDQPVSNIRTMEQILEREVSHRRLQMRLLGAFAALALLLASVGIFGVLSYAVAQRTQEIGLRMALGAQRRDVLRNVVGHGMMLTALGVAIGLAASYVLTRLMTSLLFGITATDPATFVLVSLLLTTVALLASYIPARRATKVDPLVALRYE